MEKYSKLERRMMDVFDHYDYVVLKTATKGAYDRDNILIVPDTNITAIHRWALIKFGEAVARKNGGVTIQKGVFDE